MATVVSSVIQSGGFKIARNIDRYEDVEQEYSEQNRIDNIIEWKRYNTLSAVNDLQKGLIPIWLDFDWVIPSDDAYFDQEVDVVSRDLDITIVHLKGVHNSLWKTDSERFLNGMMIDLYNDNKIQPFLLFFDNLFVPWSQFRVVKSDKFVSLLVNHDRWKPPTTIRILSIPFSVHYSEDDNAQRLYARLFGFDFNGKYNSNGPIQINPISLNIGAVEYSYSRYNKEDVGLPTNRYYTTLNIFKFKDDGSIVVDNSNDKIYNSGIITTDNGNTTNYKLVVLYSLHSNLNESISMRAKDSSYTKKIMKGDVTVSGLDIDQFNTSFDFSYSKSSTYDSNKNSAFNYIFYTDVNKFDGVYEHIKHLNLVEYDYSKLPKSGSTITMQLDICEQYPYQSYPIIFINGLADTTVNNSITYHGNQFTFSISSITYDVETFEILFIKKNINGKYDVYINSSGQIDISNCIIPHDDIVLLTDDGVTNGVLYPVPVTKTSTTMLPQDTTLMSTKLYLCSRYQFIHKRFYINDNVIILGKEFETAYDYKKFMIFADSRFINPIDYKVIYPDLSATSGAIPIPAIYFKFKENVYRYIDVYYVSSLPLGEIEPFGDLLIDCRKVKCTEDKQSRFVVPYPFKNYPRKYDSFFCIKNSLYVDKSRYVIDGDYIRFLDPDDEDFFFLQDLIFVFPYYKDEYDTDDGAIDDANMVAYKYYREITTTYNSNTITFNDYKYLTPEESVLVFAGSTYIDHTRYTLVNNKLTLLNGETFPINKVITLVVETNPKNLIGNIVINNVDEVAITKNQRIFTVTRPEYIDSFFIILGSVLVSPSRYYVNEYTNQVIFIYSNDTLSTTQKLYFVYFSNKSDTGTYSDSGTKHVMIDYMKVVPSSDSKYIDIPSYYGKSFTPTNENILVFINGTFCDNYRYKISGKRLTLITTDDKFLQGKSVDILYAYTKIRYNKTSFDPNSHDVIWFDEELVNVEYDGQITYKIPYPLKGIYDTEFIVSLNSIFIPSKYYTISNGYITFEDDPITAVNFKKGMELEFEFIHNDGYTFIAKAETTVPITAGQTVIDVPSPYNKLVNLDRRMMVFYNGLYLDKEQYEIDNSKKQITIIDSSGIRYENSEVNFVFFYTGTGSNGAVAYLSESGYFSIKQFVINRNFNNKMMLVFVNGELVPTSEILNVSNSIFKVTKDIKSRYDLNVLLCSPLVKELKDKYAVSHDLWHNTIKSFQLL